MPTRALNVLLAALLVGAQLLIFAADVLLPGDSRWLHATYLVPVVLTVWLPTRIVLLVAASAVTLLLVSWLVVAHPAGQDRLLALAELVMLAGLVLVARTSREDVARSNERVLGILEGASTGFLRMDPELVIRDANLPLARMLGLRRTTEVTGTRLAHWLPQQQSATAAAILAWLKAGDRRTFETELVRQDGQRRSVVVTAYAEQIGDRLEIAAVFADVTAIRRAEAQARASEQQLRSHLDNTPLAAVVLDAAYRIEDWNQAAERIFGFDRRRAIGMSAWDLVPLDARARRTVPFSDPEASADGDDSPRVRHVTRDGRTVHVQWYLTPLRGEDGEVNAMAALGQDVTEQLAMENALRVGEAKFSSLFHQSPDAQLLVDFSTGELVEANDTVQQMLKWPRDEVAQRWQAREDAYEQFWVRPEDVVEFRRLVIDHDWVPGFETELLTAQQEPLPVLISARRLQLGHQPMVLLTIRDLTALREAERERFRLQDQLQQAQRLEGIGRLAGGIAHDFNNMLAGIQGYTELIELQAEHPRMVADYAERIIDTTQRAADLVSKLLTFSRQSAMQRRVFELRELVHDTLDLVRQTLEPSVRLLTSLDASEVSVNGDESQLSNALLNLCINARDAIEDTGQIEVGTTDVHLDAKRASALDPDLKPGDYVRISVTDDGCGIPAEALEDIFVPFFTTKTDGRGTGLGLPSVYGAIKAHGGTVKVSSRLGEGSCFELYLPALPARSRPEPATQVREQPPQGQGHILVVDDEEGIRDTLRRSLVAMGFSVDVAVDGEDAVTRFSASPAAFDLVIMDVTMPRLSGEEAFRRLLAVRPDVVVILMSGFDRTAVLERVSGEGAAGVLKKPFTRGALIDEIRRIGLARGDDRLANTQEMPAARLVQ